MPYPPPSASKHLRTAALLLAGASLLCAQQVRRNELTGPVQDPVSIELRVQPREAAVRAQATNKAAYWFWGGIFGLMTASSVDKTRSQQAEGLNRELKALLEAYDFRASLTQRFEGGVNPDILPVLGEVRFRALKPGEPEEPLEAPAQEVLSAEYAYALSDDFRSLEVTLTCALWKPGSAGAVEDPAHRQARYFQNFTYELSPEHIAGLKDPKQRAGGWLDLGRDRIGLLILDGMNTLADALGYDLAATGREASLRSPAGTDGRSAGRLIQETATQRWIRAETGEITILEVN